MRISPASVIMATADHIFITPLYFIYPYTFLTKMKGFSEDFKH